MSAPRWVLSSIVAAFFALTAAPALEQPWYLDYDFAVKAVGRGDFDTAKVVLERLRIAKPFPEADAWTYGTWRVDYDPYYYLGLVYSNENDHDAAARAFRTSEHFGVASRDPDKRQKIEALLKNQARLNSTR